MSDPTLHASTPRVLPRIYWMLLGPVLSFVAASLIARHATWSFGWRDLLFWALLVSVLAVRWVDVRRFAGTTADGDPATLDDVRRHGLILGAVGVVLWIVVHMVHI